ncbi:MAG TPA: hypothetical protein VLT33_30655 [Labilithrix sp.]|nr:hypothetical protein [Labilithrix sp.]
MALGPNGTILWVNEGWREFARANGGPDIATKFGPGTSYFDPIAPPLRSFYEDALQNALLTGEPFEQDYECSSPDTFRLHHLRALPFGTQGLLLEHSLLVEHPAEHPDAPAITARYTNEHGQILQCANCRRARRVEGGSWDWVRPWVRETPGNASHGICSACMDYYWGARLRGAAGARPERGP